MYKNNRKLQTYARGILYQVHRHTRCLEVDAYIAIVHGYIIYYTV